MLNKKYRITSKKDIDSFFGKEFKKNKGFSASSDVLVVKSLPNKLENSRFGFIVNLKVDKRAVVRNKIKRQLREIIRNLISEIKSGYDVLFVCLPTIKNIDDFAEMEKQVKKLLKKLRLL